MEPPPPFPQQTGDPRTDASTPTYPDERARAERGQANLGAADPLDTSHPGPVLAYVRTPSGVSSENRTRSVWPRRLMLIIFVVFCMEVGIMLAVLPWKQVWTNNPMVLRMPSLRAFLGNYFVRGLFSGLGFVDLWIGFWEAVHYSED